MQTKNNKTAYCVGKWRGAYNVSSAYLERPCTMCTRRTIFIKLLDGPGTLTRQHPWLPPAYDRKTGKCKNFLNN